MYDERAGALFSGDVVYAIDEGEELLDDLGGGCVEDYVRSASLQVDIVYPGHGPFLDGEDLQSIVDAYLS